MLRVTILDMQPIDPPVGGGRLRLLGLYHGLGENIEATYVGTYDWPGEKPRDQMLSPTLREVMVPLSDAHFRAASELSQAASGRTVIDSAFHTQVDLSPEYLERTRQAVTQADVVIYSHPWLYPPTADLLDRSRQLVIYDSHNVESILRMKLLDDGGTGTQIVREVVRIERMLCQTADLVLACSGDDARAFTRLFGTSPARTRIVPNGAFTERNPPVDANGRTAAKARLKLGPKPLAIFLGSAYEPNVEAAHFIIHDLAPKLPQVHFVVAGGVGEGLEKPESSPANLTITGRLSEEDKDCWLAAADMAVNPMFSGSGTNIKMLEFMACGLPTIATPIGARGIDTSAEAFLVASGPAFAQAVARVAKSAQERTRLRANALEQVRRFYSWERISRNLGRMITRQHKAMTRPGLMAKPGTGKARPKFSVIIPTYERHDMLRDVIQRLARQEYRDFEVIVIDQSAAPWDGAQEDFGLDLAYVHSDVRGAVTARNTGALLASGEILAFTDDDTQPPPGWLAAAAGRFETQDIAGLEGLILSDKVHDPAYRPVTNQGMEGIGFMTANLFVRADVFQAIGGFDIGFENPHFREDTDLGWRIEKMGPVPFSREAWLYHPPHLRSIERESLPERSRFFIKDARLMRKHPKRYPELFVREQQWRNNPHFLHYLAEGLRMEGMQLPPELAERMKALGLELPTADTPAA
ncbi:glycosyltransferase [Xanthobacter sp. TB0139]|uniref:glycosyltransferase n=1 Tax=Xanthobacter sp. TB0139 TaxID=3459178 RepID=UPI004039AC6F